MDGGRKWTGLEPSVGEEADGEDEVSAAAAGGTVLGSEAELRDANLPDGGPTRGSDTEGGALASQDAD